MSFNLTHACSLLERTPAVLSSLLKDLPESWTHQNEGGDSWSPYDVIGHLIHGEKTDWIPRMEIILHGKDKHFEPFDRFAQFTEGKEKSLNDLLADFSRLRKVSLEKLASANLGEAELSKTGVHPEFGEVTLKQLLATWVTHDLSHLGQISRLMAKHYKEDVGPWVRYIGILNR